MRSRRIVPYLFVGILTLGVGLGIGLGISEGPVTTFNGAPSTNAALSFAHCVEAITMHTHVTKAEITACKDYSFNTDAYCPKGAGVTIVKLGKQKYILKAGRPAVRNDFHSIEMKGLAGKICFGQVPTESTPFHFSS